ncbi:hypothetical protein Tco_0909685 [Tanacetum coccineum]|uniref:Uncharacterized protein n=1 Tax=Tanacetum coccineum TaxID=301880 RepID=A0ABQ5CRZ0_9ASTR
MALILRDPVDTPMPVDLTYNFLYACVPGIRLGPTEIALNAVKMDLIAFADADHAGCQDTRRSTFGSIQLLGDRLVSCRLKAEKHLRYPVREA